MKEAPNALSLRQRLHGGDAEENKDLNRTVRADREGKRFDVALVEIIHLLKYEGSLQDRVDRARTSMICTTLDLVFAPARARVSGCFSLRRET